jgi:cytosine/adenosine deaminase-related metal-dependent hydrolase
VPRIVVKGKWTIRSLKDKQIPLKSLAVVIDNGRIADVTADPPTDCETIDVPGGIIFPGFLNLHNHTINAPLFRGSTTCPGGPSARARSIRC